MNNNDKQNNDKYKLNDHHMVAVVMNYVVAILIIILFILSSGCEPSLDERAANEVHTRVAEVASNSDRHCYIEEHKRIRMGPTWKSTVSCMETPGWGFNVYTVYDESVDEFVIWADTDSVGRIQ